MGSLWVGRVFIRVAGQARPVHGAKGGMGWRGWSSPASTSPASTGGVDETYILHRFGADYIPQAIV
jgi:hypothetical protein